MKLKLTSYHLISIIFIQIILIDLVLIYFLFGSIGKGGYAAAAETQPESKQTAVKEEKKAKNEKEPQKPNDSRNMNYLFYMSVTGNRTSLKNDVLKDVFRKVTYTKQSRRDFKLVDADAAHMTADGEFTATAYDLSYKCCGKYPSDPQYGITFSGAKAVKGRTIAVDPNIIPLGSKVHIEFQKPYTHMTGWYIAEDTGSKVKGRIIDVFFGESASGEMEKFGRRKVNVKVVKPDMQANRK